MATTIIGILGVLGTAAGVGIGYYFGVKSQSDPERGAFYARRLDAIIVANNTYMDRISITAETLGKRIRLNRKRGTRKINRIVANMDELKRQSSKLDEDYRQEILNLFEGFSQIKSMREESKDLVGTPLLLLPEKSIEEIKSLRNQLYAFQDAVTTSDFDQKAAEAAMNDSVDAISSFISHMREHHIAPAQLTSEITQVMNRFKTMGIDT